MSDLQNTVSSLSFESAMSELETIVSRLEQADVPLEQSIELFTRGEKLKAHCEQLLRAAEEKIEKITFDASGKPAGTVALDASQD